MSEPLSNLIGEVINYADSEQKSANVSVLLAQSDETETALLLESLPIDDRLALWQSLPVAKKLDVLIEMRSDPREVLINATSDDEWNDIFTDIDAEDLLELADSFSGELMERAYAAMDKVQRMHFAQANAYEEDQIGHWVTHDFLVLPLNAKVRDAKRLLRRENPRHTDLIFLVNRSGQYSEAVEVGQVHAQPEHIPLVDLSLDELPVISANQTCIEAAISVQTSEYGALPVIDQQSKLVGRVDVTTAAELTREHYERQLMATAGMDEDEDLFSPVRKSARGRAIWLGINLLTAFLASAFIGLFEATLQQVVALAVLMPVVASMGGIAGSQTLTLVIRGLALKQVSGANMQALLIKELKVGGLNGVIWAIIIGLVAMLWFQQPWLGAVIGIAILVNIVAAALSGVLVPVVLEKFNIDPALSGSVILTTVTDIVGFVAFLGLGTALLL